MMASFIIVGSVAIVFALLVLIRKPDQFPVALKDMRSQMIVFGVRLPPALLSAAFFSLIVPADLVTPYIGSDSGLVGVLIASLFGAVIPGGPILTFPLALVIWRAGAGEAQMVALLASWSVFAVHRIIMYEMPMLGPRFVAIRLASSWMTPMIAGLIALAIVTISR